MQSTAPLTRFSFYFQTPAGANVKPRRCDECGKPVPASAGQGSARASDRKVWHMDCWVRVRAAVLAREALNAR